MRTLSLLCGLSLLLAPTLSVGQQPARTTDEVFISNISVDPANCNLRVATKVRFAEVVRNSASWLGKCVAVEGYWKERKLFVNKVAVSAPDAHSLQGQLGLYGGDALFKAAPKYPRAYIAIGKVGDCKRLWDTGAMVMGYCHHHASGPYLALARITRR